MHDQLQNYLQILENIKQDIQDSDIDEIISENEEAYNEKASIEKQIIIVERENLRLINEMKKELAEKEEYTLQLETSINLLKAEIVSLKNEQ